MENFFKYLNMYPMPLWLGMMLTPNNGLVKRGSRSSVVFGVAAFNYVLAILNALRPKSGNSTKGQPSLTTLEGIGQALGTPEGALAGWSHMLALDLFTGAWIYRECQRLGAPAWVRIPSIFFTLMTGPLGLLLFLLWRKLGAKQTGRIA